MDDATRRRIVAAPAPGLDLRARRGWPQSAGVRAGAYVFLSAVLPLDPQTGAPAQATLTAQAHLAFDNLRRMLAAAGSSLERLVQVRCMIYDRVEYDALNVVYRQYVPSGPPARTVWSVRMPLGVKIQLDAIAVA